jgi:serine/threonine-protein kinase
VATADRLPRGNSDATLAVGTVVGEMEITAKVAQGGMGAIYAAVHPVIHKKAAIKVLNRDLCYDPDAVDRFVQEARSVCQIGHPNIVDVFAFGVLPDGRSYMVMDWLDGESLGERLVRGPVPVSETVAILDQVADALEAVHEQDVIHRDLKPDNIFLCPVRGGRTAVKLLDFGVAKLVRYDGAIGPTQPGMIMGTPGYMSPEQARAKDVDTRTDIYALGCVAYETVTGRLPFELDTAAEMCRRTCRCRRRRPRPSRPTSRRSSTRCWRACWPRAPTSGRR